MSHRNIAWTHQVGNFESELGHVQVQVQPGSFNNGGTGINSYNQNQGVQVGVGDPGNASHVGISGFRSYYESFNNHQQQQVQSLYPYVGVDPSFIYPSTVYNPSMSTIAASRYVPHTHSFGLGNPLPSPLYHQAMGESSSSSNFGDSNRDFIRRKNAVVESGHHSVHGFASSSSSAHVHQNPSHGPWSTSFESHVSPIAGSADGPNRSNLMTASPEFVRHGNYVFPAGHMSQCNTWIAQAANGIADRVPHRDYNNAVTNPPGQFVHSGTVGIPNGSLQDYQTGPSAICHWPLPHFGQIPVHSMQTPALYNHIQMQVPQGQSNLVHGVNPSGIRFTLDPRILALSSNSGHTLGHPIHQFLTNPVNNGSSRMLPYENTALMEDLSRLYEERHVIDEHLDMGLDIDSMTYEELVALEEQIGYVNTGLTESYILENLRSSFYVPGAACMPDQSSVETDACIICQEEYEARELVGTLDCGHKYHSACIKQWLMVKNLCPICKATALPEDGRNG